MYEIGKFRRGKIISAFDEGSARDESDGVLVIYQLRWQVPASSLDGWREQEGGSCCLGIHVLVSVSFVNNMGYMQ